MVACAGLLAVVHAADRYPSAWPYDVADWLTPAGLLQAWIALRDAQIVGHVALGRVDDALDPQLPAAARRPGSQLAEIKRLFVHPEVRGRGVGTELLRAAVRGA